MVTEQVPPELDLARLKRMKRRELEKLAFLRGQLMWALSEKVVVTKAEVVEIQKKLTHLVEELGL